MKEHLKKHKILGFYSNRKSYQSSQPEPYSLVFIELKIGNNRVKP